MIKLNGNSTISDVVDTLNWDQREMLYYLVGYTLKTGRNYIIGSGEFDNYEQRKMRETYKTLNNMQKIAVDYLIEEAIKDF